VPVADKFLLGAGGVAGAGRDHVARGAGGEAYCFVVCLAAVGSSVSRCFATSVGPGETGDLKPGTSVVTDYY